MRDKICWKLLCVVAVLSTVQVSNVVSDDSMIPDLLNKHKRVVVCYVSSWAAYRPGSGAFSIDDLDPHVCTHFVYAFAGLNISSGEIRSLDPYRDLGTDGGHNWYTKIAAIKNRMPNLKVTLAVGGWIEGSVNYSKMAADPELRRNFVASAVKLLQRHGFDGLDLDWEFPAARGGVSADKANFVQLVRELQSQLAPRNKILTAALGAERSTINNAYDIPALSKLLDFMHIMCYDYHGSWDGMTSPNAPLFTRNKHGRLSLNATVSYLKSLGAPAEKLVLGIPMYGRTFILSANGQNSASKNNEVMPFNSSAVKDKGFQGPFTREDGFMGFNEICLELKSPSTWKTAWDDISKTPYAQNGEKWLTYDDERSVAEKAKFAVQENLAGVMVWSVDTDDFRGDCAMYSGVRSTYPLMHAINVAMIDNQDHIDDNQVGHTPNAGDMLSASQFIVVTMSMILHCYIP